MSDYTTVIIQAFGLGFGFWLFTYGANRIFLFIKSLFS